MDKKRTLKVGLGLGLIAVCLTAQAMIPTGELVRKIPFASSIDSWHAVDDRHVVISMSRSKNYLLTLRRECPALPFASNFGVSASNNTIYAGFDYITADGRKCSIKTINRLSRDETKGLVGA